MVPAEVYAQVDAVTPLLKQAEHARSTAKLVPLAEQVWEQVRPLYAATASTSKPPTSTSDTSEENKGQRGGGKGSAGKKGKSPSTASGASTAQDRTIRADTAPEGASQATTTQAEAAGTGAASGGVGGNGSGDGENAGLLSGLGESLARQVAEHASTSCAYRPWSTAYDKVIHAQERAVMSHPDRMREILPHVTGVRQRLLQGLMANSRARWLPDTEDGHLNPRALHRLATARSLGEAHTSSDASSRRVFRQRVVTRRLRTAVTLLIDLSQSMRGPKIALARQTALVFGEAMAKLGVATSILGFSTGQNGVAREAVRESGQTQHDLSERFRLEPLLHVVFKTFGETFERVSGRLEHMDVHRLTPLGESMLWVAKSLVQRPEERKILFVLTDGRPAVGLGDEDITFRHAQRSIQRIERAGIDVALVGIQDASVLALHPRSVVVHRLDELPRTVITQLRQLLLGRDRTVYRHAPATSAA